MLFCFSVQKDDEYISFLGSDNDDDQGLSDSEEAHDNFINASLLLQQQTAAELRTTLAAAVAATAAASAVTTGGGCAVNTVSVGDLHSSPIKLPQTPRTFRKSITAGATSSSASCPTSKFVDPSDNHPNSNHPSTPSQHQSSNSIRSKLGPGAFIRRNLSQLRSKGTEHLQREALRKSNEAALSASIGASDSCSQRYIKLPSSAANKVILQSLSHSCNSTSVADTLTASCLSPVSSSAPQAAANCSSSKLSCPSSSPCLSPSVAQSSSSTSPAITKLTSSRSSHHKLPIAPSLPTSTPPPTLAPRSANNPPPRPKTSKPILRPQQSQQSTPTPKMSSSVAATSTSSSVATSRHHHHRVSPVPVDHTPNNSHHPQSLPEVSLSHRQSPLHPPRLATSSLSSTTTSSNNISNGVLASSPSTTTTSTIIASAATTTTTTSLTSITTSAAAAAASSSSSASSSSFSSSTSSSATTSTSNNNNNIASTSTTTSDTHHHHQHQQFINKPPRGWLHPDHKLSDSSIGVTYAVRYIGCLGVNTSMKSLDFDTRSLIAKECINRVCESAGLKTADKKRRTDKRIARMLSDVPSMDHAGVDVNLSITSAHLNLIVSDSGENLAKHDMPNISFASGGDTDTLDFAAYVAKDHRFGRACFVLECGGGRAQDVITTIGQAFELRFKEFLKRTPRNAASAGQSSSDNHHHQHSHTTHRTMNPDPDRDYYNDLPGKIPPDISLANGGAMKDSKVIPPHAAPRKKGINPNLVSQFAGASDQLSQVSLIDLNDETTMGVMTTPLANSTLNSSGKLFVSGQVTDPQYVNCMVGAAESSIPSAATSSAATTKDPFDMQPFNNALAAVQASSSNDVVDSKRLQNGNHLITKSVDIASSSLQASTSGSAIEFVVNNDLHKEDWFHGPISRNQSESLVIKDGDFLVRESQAQTGQFVLTGMQGGSRKHLLLVDPEGVVRTKDKTFESVSHLINYHRNNGLPIISSESALILKTPIVCLKSQQQPKLH